MKIIVYSFFSICLLLNFSFPVKAQIKYYEDHFRGGVTAGGYSPGTGVSSTGYFPIHIAPNSNIRKAYLFAGKQGPINPVTVELNGQSVVFDSSTLVATFWSNYSGGSVHAADVTNIITDTSTICSLYYPPGSSTSDTYTDFYLLVSYENNALPMVSTVAFLNTYDFDVNIPFHMSLTYPVHNNVDVGVSVGCGYMCYMNDGDEIYVNGNLLGKIGIPDPNSSQYCGGIMGSFYYESNTLHGLADDNADFAMDSSDALSNVQSILPAVEDTVFLLFQDDTIPPHDNSTWLVVLTYGSSDVVKNGIEDVSPWQIYPNPVKDKFNILNHSGNTSTIKLYDFSGRTVFESEFENSISIDLDQFANGIYIYDLSNKNGKSLNGKLFRK